MTILIRLFDHIIDICYFFQKYKKRLVCYSIETIIIIILFACYASQDHNSKVLDPNYSLKNSGYVSLKSSIPLKVETKKIDTDYLLYITRKIDSVNNVKLRRYPLLQPIYGKDIIAISTRYGMRVDKEYGVSRFHNGLDFAASKGTSIVTSGDGVVIDSNFDNAYGNHIQIDHQNGYVTFYGHMDSRKVIKGQTVLRGDTIGTVGSTGISTGYHLHYKITYKGKSVNPSKFRR